MTTAADLLAKGYKQDASGQFSAQGTPLEVAQERALAGQMGGPAVGANVSVTVVTPQGNRETVNLPALDHKAMGRKTDPAFERSERSVKSRIRQLGTVPAAVVSFLPTELRSDSYLFPLKVAVIKPPKNQEPYAIYVFREYFIDYTKQHVDSPTTAFEWAPIQMASDFSATNPQGVFVFSAPVGAPEETGKQLHRRIALLIEDPAWRATVSREPGHGGMTYGEAIEAKRLSAIAWMYEQLSRGNTMALSKLPHERPGFPQKAAAHRLFDLGLIQVLPEWMEQKRNLDAKPSTCPQCARRCEPGAVTCTNAGCGGLNGPYVLDPQEAYRIGAITEEDKSLERLSRRTLIEMGISDYVAESVEEKAARLKTGGIRPKSVSALRMLEYEDQAKEVDATRTGTAVAVAVTEALAPKPEKKGKKPDEF